MTDPPIPPAPGPVRILETRARWREITAELDTGETQDLARAIREQIDTFDANQAISVEVADAEAAEHVMAVMHPPGETSG
jgi:hypothetical protein